MAKEELENFFVIYVSNERSYSTIPHIDVIYDESVKIGDTVTFLWNKKEHEGVIRFISENYDECVDKSLELSAKEKKISKRNDSFHADQPRKSALKCKQNFFTKKKRSTEPCNSGFSKNKKQKIKTLSTSQIAVAHAADKELLHLIRKDLNKKDFISKKNKKPTSQIDTNKEKENNPSLRQKYLGNSQLKRNRSSLDIISVDSDKSDMNEQPSSPNSSDEISSESSDDIEAKKKKKLIHQLAAKYDIKTLQKLAADADLHSNNQLSTSETNLWKSEEFTSAAHKNLTDPEQNVKTDETVTAAGTDLYNNNQLVPVSSKTKFWKSEEFTSAALKNLTDPGQNVKTDETVTEVSKKLTVTQNHLKKETIEILLRVGVSGLSNRYTGDMFVVKDLSEGKAIDEKETMFCRTENYEYAENSKSTTMAARRLLDGVFAVEALQACSISGMPPRGKGKAAYTEKANIKPYLCPKAVKAIIDEALRLQRKFHWRPKKDRTQIRQAMGVRISEIAKMRIRPCNSSATDQL